MSRTDELTRQPDSAIERRILEALRGIRFGSVEVVIHDSRIVQIERREKFRFELGSATLPIHQKPQ